MRTVTDHIVEGDQASQLVIEVIDEPGAGGANHAYHIDGFDPSMNPSGFPEGASLPTGMRIVFQNGPIKEVGVNGVTQEALLAIVIDRLNSFQNGLYACAENDRALRSCKDALSWLQVRTRARIARGVEGTHAE